MSENNVKFKIGDRVRATKTYADITAGKIYKVAEVDHEDEVMPVRVTDDVGDRYWLDHDRFELVTPAFTLQTGKFYRTASGKPTGRVSKGDTGFEAVVNGHTRIFDSAGGAVHGDDDIVEEWVPKVGERVVFTDVCDTGWWFGPDTKSKEGTVSGPATYYSSEYQFDVSVEGEAYPAHVNIDHIEPLPVAAPQPAAAMKIEAGRYYKTRDGRKVGPMCVYSDGWSEKGDHYYRMWRLDGRRYYNNDPDSDLIAEWVDEPAAPVSAQVDAIAEEYGSGKREPRPWDRYSERAVGDNDNAQSAIIVAISLDTGNMHEELDELIAKLKKVRKLQRQVGLAA